MRIKKGAFFQSMNTLNFAIITAYKNIHTQVDISNYLKLSKSNISKIIKSGDSTPGCKF